ncbi:inositol monophosphatase family protein [Acaryochloris thomasi]|nr:inositol monophosphatase family protein [Acaryochloris thomasi]
MSDTLTARYWTACAVARSAGQLAYRYFQNLESITVESKGIQNPVTVADREVENLIISRLSHCFPTDQFLAEESGGERCDDQVWVIDPIDGTSNFVRGIPYFCVSIAYVVNQEIKIGVIYDPSRDELFAAFYGKGATRNDQPMEVTHCQELSSAMIGLDIGLRTSMELGLKAVQQLVLQQSVIRHLGSAALALAHVADGRLDSYWNPHLNPWDVLAGQLLVQEAGGWTSDFLAQDGINKGNSILACAPALRPALQQATEIQGSAT